MNNKLRGHREVPLAIVSRALGEALSGRQEQASPLEVVEAFFERHLLQCYLPLEPFTANTMDRVKASKEQDENFMAQTAVLQEFQQHLQGETLVAEGEPLEGETFLHHGHLWVYHGRPCEACGEGFECSPVPQGYSSTGIYCDSCDHSEPPF